MVVWTLAAGGAPESIGISVQWTALTHWYSLTVTDSIYNTRTLSLRGIVSSLTAHCGENSGESQERSRVRVWLTAEEVVRVESLSRRTHVPQLPHYQRVFHN